MSFEEKYGHYRKNDRFTVPDGYVDDMAGKVSEKISGRHSTPVWRVWSISASVAAVMVLGWFIYPMLTGTPEAGNPSVAYKNEASRHVAQNLPVGTPAHPENRDTFMAKENKYIAETVSTQEPSKEDILEYLLDEGYEEI